MCFKEELVHLFSLKGGAQERMCLELASVRKSFHTKTKLLFAKQKQQCYPKLPTCLILYPHFYRYSLLLLVTQSY